ncbi:hypothetical protein V8E54_006948 [Elaphomyces granulatus]
MTREIAKSGSGEETTERETTKAKAVEGGIIALATTDFEHVANTHVGNYQLPPSRNTEYPLMFLYTGITRLGDGMALYTGDSGDPVFRGWLKSEEEHYYFAIVRHLRANRRVLVGSGASALGLQTTVLIRKGTSGMGQ